MGERTERGLGAGWIIAIYCALKPVYLFSSGTMQELTEGHSLEEAFLEADSDEK